jgi:hypothetical protein
MLGTTVGGDLRTIGHAVVPDDAGNPQTIVGEYFGAAEGLRAPVGFEISPCVHRLFITEE